MKNITIKELNKLLIEHYEDTIPITYPFGGDFITQKGNILRCSFDPSIYLVSEFIVRSAGTNRWKLINCPTYEEFKVFLRSINPIMNIVTNYNLK